MSSVMSRCGRDRPPSSPAGRRCAYPTSGPNWPRTSRCSAVPSKPRWPCDAARVSASWHFMCLGFWPSQAFPRQRGPGADDAGEADRDDRGSASWRGRRRRATATLPTATAHTDASRAMTARLRPVRVSSGGVGAGAESEPGQGPERGRDRSRTCGARTRTRARLEPGPSVARPLQSDSAISHRASSARPVRSRDGTGPVRPGVEAAPCR